MRETQTLRVSKMLNLMPYKKAQVIFHEQAPWIPVAHSVGFAPLSPRVKGYVQSPFGYDAFYGVSVDGK